MVTTYYAVLGVTPGASPDEIKRQFKKLAVKYHPDKTDDAKHNEMFLEINKAYETLRDEESRKAYDDKNGIFRTTSGPSAYSEAYNYNFKTNYPGTSYGRGTSYYSFFQHNYRSYTDAARNHFDNKSSRKDDDAASAAAKLAQKKMREDLERRRQEQLFEAQRQKQEQERRDREKKLREQMEQQLQEQMERARQERKMREEELYLRAKADHHRRQWNQFYEISESDSDTRENESGNREDEPIIVEDEDVSSDNFEDCHASPPQANGHEDSTVLEDKEIQGKANHTYVKRECPTSRSSTEPEIVEVTSNDDESTRNHQDDFTSGKGPASPKRPLFEDFDDDVPTSANKKPAKNIDLSELRLSLGTSIDDTNFNDILDSLPRTFGAGTEKPPSPDRIRKSSNSVHRMPNKRAKFSGPSHGYTDGRARAQTLHTPVNKVPSKRNNSITVTDLSPEYDERKLMFTTQPPNINMTSDLTTEEWLRYTNAIHEYERGFAAFRSAVLEHQLLRFQKDERHHDTIYDDTSCLDAFLSTLFNDMLIFQNYGRALQEFRNVVKTFRDNCELKREIEARDNIRI